VNAADPRIKRTGARLRRGLLRPAVPGRAARAGTTIFAGLLLVVSGVATFSTGLALITAGLLLVVSAVGYMRGTAG
jgi:hypothetical protein